MLTGYTGRKELIITITKVQKAANRRGIYFDGIKKFRNTTVGNAYEIYTPNGRGFYQADTLNGLYRKIMEYSVIK